MKKIIITPKEVAALLQYSDSYGRKIVREIKEKLEKKYVTYQDFADYFGFTKEEVLEGLKGNSNFNDS